MGSHSSWESPGVKHVSVIFRRDFWEGSVCAFVFKWVMEGIFLCSVNDDFACKYCESHGHSLTECSITLAFIAVKVVWPLEMHS